MRRAAQRRIGARVTRGERPAAERGLAGAARDEDVGDAAQELDIAAVGGGGDREVAVVEAVALEDAGAHGGQGLERLGGRAEEHRPGLTAGARGAVGLVQAPGKAVHALEVPAAQHADRPGGGAQARTVSAPGSTS